MLLMSERPQLLVVDEAILAIDPSGEYKLIQILCSICTGKTMVFVTHRFGHLTRHADLIL
jgi:ABC-type bacteriocin/lantibiotic exporter with double-glycine peptidase domain